MKTQKKKINFEELVKAIENSWDKDTCYPFQQNEWTNENPAWGQCAVTALIIQDYLGGVIAYNSQFKHYWNILPDNATVDLTKKQFIGLNENIKIDNLVLRENLLNGERALSANTKNRYFLLKQKVMKNLLYNERTKRERYNTTK